MLLPMTAIVSMGCVLGSEVSSRTPGACLPGASRIRMESHRRRALNRFRERNAPRSMRTPAFAWWSARGRKDVSASDVFTIARRGAGSIAALDAAAGIVAPFVVDVDVSV
ncbi:hypothetical protein [Burkholderia pseudomallei]|uniref:hypothetical protein n=1 Tax=Burkholderia pseudomallei TaxID=28450 RepID=UPI001F354AC2|nr:hypothetical protein [Burkholderia pseudomallei]